MRRVLHTYLYKKVHVEKSLVKSWLVLPLLLNLIKWNEFLLKFFDEYLFSILTLLRVTFMLQHTQKGNHKACIYFQKANSCLYGMRTVRDRLIFLSLISIFYERATKRIRLGQTSVCIVSWSTTQFCSIKRYQLWQFQV